jgi:hypothetical protein
MISGGSWLAAAASGRHQLRGCRESGFCCCGLRSAPLTGSLKHNCTRNGARLASGLRCADQGVEWRCSNTYVDDGCFDCLVPMGHCGGN